MALFGLQKMGGRPADRVRQGQRSDPSPELRAVVSYVTSLIAHHKGSFETKRVCMCVLGLSSLSCDASEVKLLVKALADKAITSVGQCSGHEMSMCLHGLAGMRSECPEVGLLVKGLAHVVASCPSVESPDVSSALVGLQGLKSRAPNVDMLVGALADVLARSNCSLTSHDALMAVHGLQGLTSSSLDVQKLLRGLLPMLRHKDDRFGAQELSMALFACKSMSSQNDETLQIVSTLADYCEAFSASGRIMPLTNVCSALYGLQKLRSDSPAVLRLVSSLVPIVRSAEGNLTAKSMSSALNGLQGMDSKHNETLLLLGALVGHMERAEAGFAGFDEFQEVSSSLYGLSSMSGEAPPVYKALCSLARLMARSDLAKPSILSDVRAENVAAALFGLQKVSSRVQPARDILLMLAKPMESMGGLKGKELGMALQGFRLCAGKPPSGHDEVLSVLSRKVAGWSAGRKGQRNGGELQITLRSALWGISNLDRKQPSVREVLVAIAKELEEGIKSGSIGAQLEGKTLNAIKEVYRGGDVEAIEEVQSLLAALGLPREDSKPPVKKWKKKEAVVSAV